MIAASSDLSIMVRRCLLTFKPFRIFVVGIGFFSLCFLMTSLGGQLSAKRPGDSPFTVQSEGMRIRSTGSWRNERAEMNCSVELGLHNSQCTHP
ncbi:hypothetical protein OYC64_006399 [Pagothenia borchgrevinki]|uniref:Uncharacterized protein n=1 Tax=Pagothenia borchgrevinki TaxID=8213 RepID=A0ABD2GJ10_PAGBO